MKVIVDTNIVFSGILNSNGKIGELLIKSKDYFEFFSVDQLKNELYEHKEKIKKIGHYTESEYQQAREIGLSKIKVIRDILIPKKDIIRAEDLLKDIDIDDCVFFALALNLDAKLWTGDMELINGLQKKGIYQTITTSELYELYLNAQIK